MRLYMLLKVLLMSSSLLFVSVHATEQPVTRIINGTASDLSDHDYYVTILTKFPWANGYHYNPFCGGSYLGSGRIVTAAHCVYSLSDSAEVYLLIGNHSDDMQTEYCKDNADSSVNDYCQTTNEIGYHSTNWIAYVGSESNLHAVKGSDFIIHQGYTTNSLRYDIALIQLDYEPTNLALTLPDVDLFESMASSGSSNSVLVIGHGDTISDSDERTFQQSADLLEVALTPYTDSTCDSASSYYDKYTMVCAGDPGEDSCQGDSGGPLIEPTTNSILGIVSFGPLQCGAASGSVGYYTNVYEMREWIESGGQNFLHYQYGSETVRLGNIGIAGSLSIHLMFLVFLLLIRVNRNE